MFNVSDRHLRIGCVLSFCLIMSLGSSCPAENLLVNGDFGRSKPKYRVMYNKDCSDLFDVTRKPITPQRVERMVDEIADGGADVDGMKSKEKN